MPCRCSRSAGVIRPRSHFPFCSSTQSNVSYFRWISTPPTIDIGTSSSSVTIDVPRRKKFAASELRRPPEPASRQDHQRRTPQLNPATVTGRCMSSHLPPPNACLDLCARGCLGAWFRRRGPLARAGSRHPAADLWVHERPRSSQATGCAALPGYQVLFRVQRRTALQHGRLIRIGYPHAPDLPARSENNDARDSSVIRPVRFGGGQHDQRHPTNGRV